MKFVITKSVTTNNEHDPGSIRSDLPHLYIVVFVCTATEKHLSHLPDTSFLGGLHAVAQSITC